MIGTIRFMIPQDAPHLYAIAHACFADPWSQAAFEWECGSQTSRTLVAVQEGDVVGFLNAWVVCGECTLNNVGILPAFRGHGTGSRLLCALIALAQREHYEFITLEVRRSNAPAVRLYEKHGFKRVGERKGFYTNPSEDALLMTYPVEKENQRENFSNGKLV